MQRVVADTYLSKILYNSNNLKNLDPKVMLLRKFFNFKKKDSFQVILVVYSFLIYFKLAYY